MTATSPTDGPEGFSCPIPIDRYPQVLLAHGGGGSLMHQLIEQMIVPGLGNPLLEHRHDGAILDVPADRLAFTTDSFVVRPLFFRGGDIGTLAINGTVNDLAMCGARPRYLSAGFILEEGLAMETLWRVIQSMRRSAEEAGVSLVTGDTKVVDRGKGDGIFINTAGIGVIEQARSIHPGAVRAGDVVILSGDLGRHGIAILAEREGLEFEGAVESDCAPLCAPVHSLLGTGVEVHCLRDLTRGGLASALVEIAEAVGLRVEIEEDRIPVTAPVRGACEILGLDPLYVANEGRFIAFVPAPERERALTALRAHGVSAGATAIGTVIDERSGMVTMKSRIGATRIVDMLSGEQLPRIC